MIENIPVKEVITLASPLIKSIVETYISPKLISFKEKFKLDLNKYHVPTEEHFSEYFHRTYKKISYLNTLVFSNTQLLLKDIYLPLTIRMESSNNKTSLYKIDSCPIKLITEFEKILITDTAGMGKSTLMKRIYLDIIDRKIGVPILIELRRLSKQQDIHTEIHEQINSIHKEFDPKLLKEFISEGGFIFLLDGFDEISLIDKEIVTADIQKFIEKSSKNKFLLTSRPENALKSFGDFQLFSIDPLKKKEAFELLRKYDKQGTISTLLIKKLEDSDMSNIDEFLINPLLVTLLYTAFQHKQSIPFKKYLFYRQVFDANFEAHDLTKGDSYSHDKFSKLEIDDFHKVLRHIGFTCFKKQKIEFTKDEILNIITLSKIYCVGLNFTESDFLKDILSKVPLFIEDGNFYRWAHKSLQEYFAAQFIYLDSKELQINILKTLIEHKEIEKFSNILDLFYDMDFKAFRDIILFDILNEYKLFYDSTYQNLDTRISRELITQRKELTFIHSPYIFFTGNHPKDIFDNNKIAKMINEISKSKLNINKNFTGIVVTENNNENIYAFYFENPKRVILNILARKKNECIAFIGRGEEKQKITYGLNEIFDKKFKYLEVNDEVKNGLNTFENFEITNKILENSHFSGYKLNSDFSLRLLNEINKTLEEEKEGTFLFENI